MFIYTSRACYELTVELSSAATLGLISITNTTKCSAASTWHALKVPTQSLEPGQPPKATLHHPMPGHQHKASLDLLWFDHLQIDATALGSLLGLGLCSLDRPKPA